MKRFKLLLLALLILVGAAYLYTNLSSRLSGEDVPPAISCPETVLEISVNDPEEVLLSGITAQDEQDGDLTGRILLQGISKLISEDSVRASYLVFDSDGNLASATRTIRYTDYRTPRFYIRSPLVYTASQSIGLLDRLTADDVIDGDITNLVRVSSMSATGDPEIYLVTVQVTNSLGSTTQQTLPLIQYATSEFRPTINLNTYLVYMDQGTSFNPRSYLDSVEISTREEGDLADVTITNNVNTGVPGTYMVYYRYAYEGTTALAVLTVIVE